MKYASPDGGMQACKAALNCWLLLKQTKLDLKSTMWSSNKTYSYGAELIPSAQKVCLWF